MPLWTLYGLLEGKATTRWPNGDGPDGQEGVLGMPKFDSRRCDADCSACAEACPTGAIVVRSEADKGQRLEVDYGRCVVCQLCVEACPTGAASSSFDWALGTTNRSDLVFGREDAALRQRRRPRRVAQRLSPQSPHPPCRRGLVQRLRIRTASAQQSLLQSPSFRHLLHAFAAVRRSAAGHRTGDLCDA